MRSELWTCGVSEPVIERGAARFAPALLARDGALRDGAPRWRRWGREVGRGSCVGCVSPASDVATGRGLDLTCPCADGNSAAEIPRTCEARRSRGLRSPCRLVINVRCAFVASSGSCSLRCAC
eukprot:5978570-Prymnesium_polylepis.2